MQLIFILREDLPNQLHYINKNIHNSKSLSLRKPQINFCQFWVGGVFELILIAFIDYDK